MTTKELMWVFDVDGTLLNNKLGGFKDILVILGRQDEVLNIDKEYQRRKHLGPWGLKELVGLYKGYEKSELEKASYVYCLDNLMPGIQEVIKKLKDEHVITGAISSNPQFIMDNIKNILGLDFACGCELEFIDGVATGKIIKKVDRDIKAEILATKMKELDLVKDQVCVVGDSLTDLPMAKLAGKFIAFCPNDDNVRQEADVVINKRDLREILNHL